MPTFERKYTDAQRDALAEAYEVRRIRPARRVAELAAKGELDPGLPPFETKEASIRAFAVDLRKRRAGEVKSRLLAEPPRDAVEDLRRRLICAADAMLVDLERKVKRDPGAADPERHRQISRAVREVAALPDPGDPRPPQPGRGPLGERVGGPTRGGVAGAILAKGGSDAGLGAAMMQAHRDAPLRPPPPAPPVKPRESKPRQPEPGPESQAEDDPLVTLRERAAVLGLELPEAVLNGSSEPDGTT